MSNPWVSVLLPVRDAMPFLEQVLKSLDRQTLVDFEVVAVDDGSTDGSGELLDRWAGSDSRIRVLHRPPSGLVATLNAGLQECRAPLVARMDADDLCHPRRLELQLSALENQPEVGIVSTDVRFFPRSQVEQGFRIYERWLNSLRDHDQMARERFVESPVAHPSVMVRRELVDRVGGYRDVDWPEDYDLWLRLFEDGARFAKLDRPLYFWREHPLRLTRVDDRYSKEAFLSCKAHYLVTGPLDSARRTIIWGAGPTGRRLSRLLAEAGASIDAFVDIDPEKIGRSVHGREILAPERLEPILGAGAVVLAAVASRGARELIRSRLASLGLVEGADFYCVA
jgi:glycosyltransferase involved in cell wall biosynthesis